MRKLVVSVVSALFLITGVAFAGGHEKGHHQAHWGYSGENGPAHWGDLKPEYFACKSGKNQSPINLTGMIKTKLPAVKYAYGKTSLAVVNNGHAIQANYAKGAGKMTFGGHTYKLLQFHFHSPSENTIKGKSFPLEAHLVHADDAGNLAVVTVMFTKGKANKLLEKVWKIMPTKAGKTNTAKTKINVSDLLPKNKGYYYFNGSLTTPPCSEGVRWIVLKSAVNVSKAQVDKFHSVMHQDTNRPVQPLNAREVLQ